MTDEDGRDAAGKSASGCWNVWAAYIPGSEESELERAREIERNRRPGAAAGGA